MKRKAPYKRLGTFQCGPYTVPVFIVPEKKITEGKVVSLGECHTSYCRPAVLLNSNLVGEARDNVLLHETLHLVSWLSGAGLSERDVESLSNLLAQALRTFKPAKRKSRSPQSRKNGR